MASFLRRLLGGAPSSGPAVKGCQHDTITTHTKTNERNDRIHATETIIIATCHDCGGSVRFNMGVVVADELTKVKEIVLKARGYQRQQGATWSRSVEG